MAALGQRRREVYQVPPADDGGLSERARRRALEIANDADLRIRAPKTMFGQDRGLALYDYSVDGGATCTPANSDTIPDNAVVFGGVVNSTAAVTASGSATVSIGTAAGSGAASILTATGKASLGLDAVVVPTCVATPFKMTAAGKINVTIATGPLTAGVIEVWVLYTAAAA